MITGQEVFDWASTLPPDDEVYVRVGDPSLGIESGLITKQGFSLTIGEEEILPKDPS